MGDYEDIIQENSPLHCYMRDVGFNNVDVIKPTCCTDFVSSPERSNDQVEAIDRDVFDEVQVLKATNLLFEDDLEHVNSIFSNYQLTKHESMKYLFRSKSCALVLVIGLCFYVYVGGYAFILISIYYAYRTSDYLWRKHTRLKILKNMMTVLQSNFSVLTKVIRFLHENEQILKSRLIVTSKNSTRTVISCLRNDFIILIKEINEVLADVTIKLIKEVPLSDYLEDPDSYSCQSFKKYRDIEAVSQLHSLYMLLQSQFLTRLTFSLIPNLYAKEMDTHQVIMKLVLRLTSKLKVVHSVLNRKFKLAMMKGINLENGDTRLLPPKQRSKLPNDLMLKNVHDLSNSLQFSLLKSRDLEERLETGDNQDLDQDLIAIQSELSACLSHINDLIIVFRKHYAVDCYSDGPKRTEFSLENTEAQEIPITEIGLSSLDPDVPDDIFEMTEDSTFHPDDTFPDYVEEVDQKSKVRQKQMLVELKYRLKEQAEDWARREALVFARKGLPVPDKDVESDEGLALNALRQRIVKEEEESGDERDRRKPMPAPRYKFTGEPLTEGANLFAQTIRQAQSNFTHVTDECTFGDSDDSSDNESSS